MKWHSQPSLPSLCNCCKELVGPVQGVQCCLMSALKGLIIGFWKCCVAGFKKKREDFMALQLEPFSETFEHNLSSFGSFCL